MHLKSLKDTPPWDWPKDAGEKLLGILRDEGADETDRLLAAEMAGSFTVIDDELAGALLSIVEDVGAPENLRGRAAISFGPVLDHADMEGFDDPSDTPISESTFRRVQESLQKLHGDPAVPKEVRRRILEASVRAPSDWHQDAVRAAWASDDADWRLTAVFSMRWIRGFDEEILEALQSDDPRIHCEAVRAAGEWEIDAAWPHIKSLATLGTRDKDLLLAAIAAVADIRPLQAGEVLGDLTTCGDEDVVEAALEAMDLADAQTGLFFEDEDEDEDEEEEEDEDDYAGPFSLN